MTSLNRVKCGNYSLNTMFKLLFTCILKHYSVGSPLDPPLYIVKTPPCLCDSKKIFIDAGSRSRSTTRYFTRPKRALDIKDQGPKIWLWMICTNRTCQTYCHIMGENDRSVQML